MRIIINKNTFLSIFVGIFTAFSFPNFYIPFLYIFGFTVWFYIIYRSNYKKTLIYSFFTGFSFALLSYYWIIKAINYYGGVNLFVSIILLILFSFFYSLFYFVSFGVLLRYFFNRYSLKAIFLAPFIWVLIEISREYFPFSGFPWNLAGYMISYIQPIDKLAAFLGIYGLSFLAIFIPSILFFSYVKRDIFSLIIGVSLPALIYIVFSFYKLNLDYMPKYKVAILQGNIEENIKQDKNFTDYIVDTYIELFKEASKFNPDIIVMPESALGFFYFSESIAKERFFNSIKDIEIPFIVGLDNIVIKNDSYKIYNSIFLFNEKHELIDYYNKIKLVPFGEYVPFPFKVFSKLFPYLEGWDFLSGEKKKILQYKNLKFIPLICFEAIFPNFVSDFSKKGNVIVNISNDAWFGKTSAPFQHFEMTRIRAIETGKYLIRATNTGISAIIEPDGNVQKMSGLFKRQILIGYFSPRDEKTFWTKYKKFIFITFMLTFVIILARYEHLA